MAAPPEPRIFARGPHLPADLGLPFAHLADRRSKPPERRAAIEHLVPRLSDLIGAPVDGLVIYGSARRVDDPGDIDALITVAEPVRGGLWGDAGGHELDVFVHASARLLASEPADWPHLARGEAVFDPSGRLAPFIGRVKAHRDGPGPAPDAIEAVQLPVWARRQLARIHRRRDSDPALAAMHRAGLIAALPALWRIARSAHGTSPTDWIRSTCAEDPTLAPHIDALADPARVDAALEAIIEALFPGG